MFGKMLTFWITRSVWWLMLILSSNFFWWLMLIWCSSKGTLLPSDVKNVISLYFLISPAHTSVTFYTHTFYTHTVYRCLPYQPFLRPFIETFGSHAQVCAFWQVSNSCAPYTNTHTHILPHLVWNLRSCETFITCARVCKCMFLTLSYFLSLCQTNTQTSRAVRIWMILVWRTPWA